MHQMFPVLQTNVGKAKAIKSPITLLITGTQVNHRSLQEAQPRDRTGLKLLSYLRAQSETELEELVFNYRQPPGRTTRTQALFWQPLLLLSVPLLPRQSRMSFLETKTHSKDDEP